jgi:hypothetical protein
MLQLLAVLLVYAGGIAALVGLASVVRPLRFLGLRRRRAGAVVFGAGLAGALAGFLLPAPVERVAGPRTRLDAVMPAYHFHEVHSVRVRAPRERVLQAVRDVTAGEIRLFRTLTWIRSPRLGPRTRESVLDAPEDKPILDVALRSGFVELGGDPDREIVLGTAMLFARPPPAKVGALERAVRAVRGGQLSFADFNPPGFAKAVMNFLVEDEAEGWCRLRTETRIFATDEAARRGFTVYWRLIYPGSALIRRMWLQAVKRRAEAS